MRRTTGMQYLVVSILAAFDVVLCQGSCIAAEEDKPPKQAIILSAKEGPRFFGCTISLHVSYRNDGNAEWKVRQPEKSSRVSLKYRPSGSDKEAYGYSMAPAFHSVSRIGADGQMEDAIYTYSAPPFISIAPGKTYEFDVDWERDWSGWVVPGRWAFWLIDHNAKIESSHVEFGVPFTRESITECLEVAMAKNSHVYKRKRHAEWLQKIMPGLELRWWKAETPEAERRPMEEEVQRQLKKFEDFMKDPKNAAAIDEAIGRINKEAGLDDEKPKAEDKGK